MTHSHVCCVMSLVWDWAGRLIALYRPVLVAAECMMHLWQCVGAGDTMAGVNTVEWDGRNGNGRTVGNGGYIYTLSSGSFSVTKKIAIVR